MLIGQPPFTGPSFHAVIARHSLEPVPSLRVVRDTVSPGVEGSVIRAMAKLPADRFASMQRFLDALDSPDIVPVQPALPASARSGAGPRVSRRVMGARGVGVLVVAAVAWWFAAGPTARPAHPGARAVTSVAVLPFRDAASNPDSSYLADGMTEGLIADLAQIG
jgi:serine/threonine-protein kinase